MPRFLPGLVPVIALVSLWPLMLLAQSTTGGGTSVVSLTDDEVLVGEVEDAGDSIVVKTRLLGQVRVPKSSVKEMRPASPQATLLPASDQAIVPMSVSAKPGVPSSTVIQKLKISTAVVASTQRDQNYTAEIDLQKNWSISPNWDHGQRTWLILSPSYDDKWKVKRPSSNVTQVYSGSLQHLFIRNANTSFYLLGHAYHNNTQGIRVEQAYGIGAIRDVDFTKIGSFEFSADVRVISQNLYKPGKDALLAGSNFQLRYYKALPAKLTFQTTLGVIPAYNQATAWESSGLAEISYPITPKLSLVLGAVDNYYEIAPKTFNKNYLKSTVSLQYTPAKAK